jgi:hypothetical protein
MLSEAYYEEVVNGKYQGLEAEGELHFMEFDDEGNLVTPIHL